MKKLERKEMKVLLGGLLDNGPACKTSTITCTYLTPNGTAYTGSCGSTTSGPMGSKVCGCSYNGLIQADSSCNAGSIEP